MEIIPTRRFKSSFKKLAKKFPSLKTDYASFETDLRVNTKQGVDLGNGFRKVRLAIQSKGKGKSGMMPFSPERRSLL
jgi:hypothetical protein